MADVPDLSDPRRRRAFQEWIVAQRWFGSKSREVSQIELAETVTLRTRAAAARARARRGALRRGHARDLPGAARAAARGRGLGRARDRARPTAGPSTTRSPTPRRGASCCTGSARASTWPLDDGVLRFRWAETAAGRRGGTVEVRPVGVEQSNSSVVFGEELILKVFRRPGRPQPPTRVITRGLAMIGSSRARRPPRRTAPPRSRTCPRARARALRTSSSEKPPVSIRASRSGDVRASRAIHSAPSRAAPASAERSPHSGPRRTRPRGPRSRRRAHPAALSAEAGAT